MESIELKWSAPFSFRQLLEGQSDSGAADLPGLYLWTHKINEVPSVVYVGKTTRSIRVRQLEHYRFLLGGSYWIPERSRSSGREWSPGIHNDETRRVLFDMDRFVDLARDAWAYADSIRIQFATGIPEQLGLARVERCLIDALQPEQNGNVNLRNEERLILKHHGESIPMRVLPL